MHESKKIHDMTNETELTIPNTWTSFLNAHRRAAGAVERDLRAKGMASLDWVLVLDILCNQPDGLRQKILMERSGLPKYTLSRVLDRMSVKRLIVRKPVPGDRRGSTVYITPEGEAERGRVHSTLLASVEQHFLSLLTEGEQALLGRLLGKISV